MRVEVEIGELVLHGFAPGDRHRVAAALEQELGRLVAARELPRRWASSVSAGGLDAETIDAGSVEISPETPPRTSGQRIAGALYQGLESGERR